MLEKKVLSSGLFCFLYNNKIKIALGSSSLMHAGLVQFASKMHQDALSIYRGQWFLPKCYLIPGILIGRGEFRIQYL